MEWLEKASKEIFIRCETVGCSQYFMECEFPVFTLKQRQKQPTTGVVERDFFNAIRVATGSTNLS
jgi:hypothetical protein